MPPAQISAQRQSSQRNQSMEVCKFIASLFVVFIHAPFPGTLGSFADCLARFAVPMFFMITGYFNFEASSQQIVRRIKHLLLLFLIGALFRQLCECICIELSDGSTIAHLRSLLPEMQEVFKLIILHIPPYTGNLWYLAAILTCYLIFWGFTRFQEDGGKVSYRPFYTLCMCAFSLFFLLDILLPVSGSSDFPVSPRNGWLFGLSMFGTGLFLHQFQDKLFRVFSLTTQKLWVIFILGILLSVGQWKCLSIGIVPFGMLFSVPALVLLTIRHPILVHRPSFVRRVLLELGPLSMWIYLFHLPLLISYNRLFQVPLQSAIGSLERYLYPWIIAVASLLAGVSAEIFLRLLKRKR